MSGFTSRRPPRWYPCWCCWVRCCWASTARGETSGQQLAETVGHKLVGSPAPKLELKTIDGETIDLGSLYGKKAVYLKFWATWCVPCRQQMPHFEHAFESAGPDLAVIAIDVGLGDSLEEIRRFQRQAWNHHADSLRPRRPRGRRIQSPCHAPTHRHRTGRAHSIRGAPGRLATGCGPACGQITGRRDGTGGR